MHVLLRGTRTQQLRLASGLVLATFVVTHFANHALGLVSLDAMLAMQGWRTAATRSVPGAFLLMAAFVVHISLALWKLSRRATVTMPVWEALQIATGLAVPYLLLQHVMFNRGANLASGTRDTYAYELSQLWPGFAWDQVILLAIVWVHVVIGLHYWLRLDRHYRRAFPLLVALATALPILAVAGFVVAGREMADRLAEPGAREALMLAARPPDGATSAWLDGLKSTLRAIFYSAAALALAFPLAAMALRAARARIAISYVAGPLVRAVPGPTLLEISRMNGVAHASVCGGRARCSTCRVHVGDSDLPPPEAAEADTLASVGAPRGVRLACQIRPTRDSTVWRLVTPVGAADQHGRDDAHGHGLGHGQGRESAMAVMFFDLRDFTTITEKKLPYDTVFLLNGLFGAVAAAVEQHGGRVDKYMGDGLMAVFAGDGAIDRACADAIAAAIDIDLALDRFSSAYQGEVGQALRCAIGVHSGTLVAGRIGSPRTAAMTVVGPVVNAASRLETMAKDWDVQLAVSRGVLAAAGYDAAGLVGDTLHVRGFSDAIDVVLVERARHLAGARNEAGSPGDAG